MIQQNTKDIKSIKLGAESVSKVYLKNTLIYPTMKAVAGDYAFYNGEKVCIIPNDTDLTTLPENYIPIGVVVVPGTHNVYGDGSCGVMSLKTMDYNFPDTGSTNAVRIFWGNTDSTQKSFTTVPIGNTTDGNPTSHYGFGYLPCDEPSASVTYQCLHDTDTSYDMPIHQIPSPYLTDDSRNPGYYSTDSPSTSDNSLSDFNGIDNSQRLWDLATKDVDWKTSRTLTNDIDNGYCPAACCCWRYHTNGTNQGDWYFPAMGEIGYIVPKFSKIKHAINTIQGVYGTTEVVPISTQDLLWSSTQFDSDSAQGLYMSYGAQCEPFGKTSSLQVRAWLRVNSGGVVRN